ncbi:MAG TPA: lysophospholipid acyltransferase family protein [Polyangiaceae bacterium]|nr:lysophospholipid acyltransferase family protein [Polyangiaceae bacterium]
MAAITAQPPPALSPLRPRARGGVLAYDGLFWRRAARFGARRGPSWFVRWAPPVIGAALAVAMPDMRRRISGQLARARGRVGTLRDAIDVVRTVANFASCMTELLSTGSTNDPPSETTLHRSPRVDDLLSTLGGVIFATAHTAGWEMLGALLARDHHRQVMVVMQRERDEGARKLQDAMREARGRVRIVHVGDDPLASLPLMRHLRDGGVVALQIDRVPTGMAGRSVRIFGHPAAIPEGPLRLAQLTGAPILTVFSARTGYRRYAVYVNEPLIVPRWAEAEAIDAAAQHIADELGDFVSAHPTQWFPFHD